jgi:hypothetical protein
VISDIVAFAPITATVHILLVSMCDRARDDEPLFGHVFPFSSSPCR